MKGKPLIEMTTSELEDVFDKAGLAGDRMILNDARKQDSDIVLALAMLDIPGVGSRIAIYTAEYGDGDGNHYIDEFIRTCQKHKLLRAGETLRRVEWRAAVTARSGIQ